MANEKLIRPLARVEIFANATESAYADRLFLLKRAGEIMDYRYQPIKLVLAHSGGDAKGTLYIPDFMVVCAEAIEFHEVKGFWRDDARVKIKVAATLFPWFRFVAVQRIKREWRFEYLWWTTKSRH